MSARWIDAGAASARGRVRVALSLLSSLALALLPALALAADPAAAAAPEKPKIGNATVEGIGASIATLRAEIDPDGEATSYRFEYGESESYGTSAPIGGASIGSGAEMRHVSVALRGLAPNTVYHYRVVASNAQGTVMGADRAFNTFGVTSFGVSVTNANGTPDLEAGSHPYQITTQVKFPTFESEGEVELGGILKDLEMNFPVGLSGDPKAVPECRASELAPPGAGIGRSTCAPDTQVGLLTLELSKGGGIEVPLFNLVPEPGIPVQFGVYAVVFPLTIEARIRADHGYALGIKLKGISEILPFSGVSVTLWGVPADPGHDPYRGNCIQPISDESTGSCPSGGPLRPFLTLPTQCETPPTFDVAVDSWAQPETTVVASSTGEGNSASESDLTGCGRLDFAPSLSVSPETSVTDSPSGLRIDVGLPSVDSVDSKAEAAMKDVRVALPPGLSINVAAADGLGACAPAQIGLGSDTPVSCPGSSQIGDVKVDTPMLPAPLVGSIYLGQPPDPFEGDLTGYIVAEGSGVLIKLAMQIAADPLTGQLTVTVNDLPQIAFTDMQLDFRGGPRAALATPPACGVTDVVGQITPYSTPALPVSLASGFATELGCAGGFSPMFVAGNTSTTAGASSEFVLQVSRADGEQQLRGVTATLPPGLLARLGSVSLCEAGPAASGGCGSASQVGHVAIAAGAGPHPFYLKGTVFLTGPYEGAPFGLSIVVPALAGPFDLGTVVLRARLLVDRHDAQLTIDTDPLPTILKGVPLRLRSLIVDVDRPAFILNPTSCARRRVTGEVASAQTTASVSSPFLLTGCSKLRFSPTISASMPARVSLARGAGLNLHIGVRGAKHANIGSVALVFPSQLSARLKAIQRACRHAVFARNPADCPSGSRVGGAQARTAVLGDPMEGPVYLISNGTSARPTVALVLQGDGVTLELTGALRISHGAVSLTLDALPDAPISSLSVQLFQGPAAVLGANGLSKAAGSLCRQRLVLRTAIVAQNGLRAAASPRVWIDGCRAPVH